MQRYLIYYEFTDGEDQEEGAEMLINWIALILFIYHWYLYSTNMVTNLRYFKKYQILFVNRSYTNRSWL